MRIACGYLRLQTQNQNMQYYLLFPENNGYANALQSHDLRTLPVLLLVTAQWQHQVSKVKDKKAKFTLEQATKAQKGVEIQLYSFLNLGDRWGGYSMLRSGRFTPRKDPAPIVSEVGWAPGLVWMGAKNLAPPPAGFDPRTV
jgi:hypothetical protein